MRKFHTSALFPLELGTISTQISILRRKEIKDFFLVKKWGEFCNLKIRRIIQRHFPLFSRLWSPCPFLLRYFWGKNIDSLCQLGRKQEVQSREKTDLLVVFPLFPHFSSFPCCFISMASGERGRGSKDRYFLPMSKKAWSSDSDSTSTVGQFLCRDKSYPYPRDNFQILGREAGFDLFLTDISPNPPFLEDPVLNYVLHDPNPLISYLIH